MDFIPILLDLNPNCDRLFHNIRLMHGVVQFSKYLNCFVSINVITLKDQLWSESKLEQQVATSL